MAKKQAQTRTGVSYNEKGRRIVKGPISFRMELTAEQVQAKKLAMENDVVILTGKPGTSKTTLNCNIALDLLFSRKVAKIIVTRPMVDVGRTMGFLPGEAFDFQEGKMAPYLAPILQAMYKLSGKEVIDNEITKGNIEIVPIQFIRGLNFEDAVVLVDEAQNATYDELKALSTRLCKDAKLLFTSDLNQVDLMAKNSSAGHFFNAIADLNGVALIELTENFRSPLALEIMDRIDNKIKEYRAKEGQ